MNSNPTPDRPVNDMRELYAVQHAITDAGGTLTPGVHKAIDDLREVWDAGLRQAQAEAHQYRTALQGVARRDAAVPCVSAVDQTTRDRIAEALHHHLARTADIRPSRGGDLAFMPEVTDEERMRITDALLAVLPPPADRAAVLRENADRIDATAFPPNPEDTFETGAHWATAELRRLAAEASTPEAVAHPTRYTVSHLGAQVTVEERDPGRWAVVDRSWCMSVEGQWHFEPRPSERDDLWLAEHRFDLDAALAMAKAALGRSAATSTGEEQPS